MNFNLNDAIREVIEKSDSPDPHVIADEVVTMIPPRDLRRVVSTLLPYAVRMQIHNQRKNSKAAPKTKPTPNGKRDVGEMTNDPLRMQYCVSGVWKFLGDMTVDDLEAAASEYDDRAAANTAMARWFRDLADQVRVAGVKYVRELPAEDVA